MVRGVALLALRLVLLAAACACVLWAVRLMPAEEELGVLGSITDAITRAEQVPLRRLQPALSYLDRTEHLRQDCQGRSLRHAGIIRQYAAALAHNDKRNEAAALLDKARDDLRASLACAPASAFHWYELFAVELARGIP